MLSEFLKIQLLNREVQKWFESQKCFYRKETIGRATRNKQPHTYARLCDFIFFKKATMDESANGWIVHFFQSMSEFKVQLIVICNARNVSQIIWFIMMKNIKPCLTDVKSCIYLYVAVCTETVHGLAIQGARGIISYNTYQFHPAYQYIPNTRRIKFLVLVVNLYDYLCSCTWQQYKIWMRG